MNSSGQPIRRIASNLLWSPEGFLRHPLVTVAADGEVLGVEQCAEPDRLAGVEFYGGVLLPGLVNAHCHLELAHLGGAIPAGCGFTGFIRALRAYRHAATADERRRAADRTDAAMRSRGIRAVGDTSNGLSSFATKRRSALRYHTFAEFFGLRGSTTDHLAPLLAEPDTSATPHSLYSVQQAPFAELAARGDAPLSLHYLETPGERELFRQRGELWEWYRSEGLACDFLHYGSPTRRLVEQTPRDRSLLLVHATCTTQEDIDLLREHFTAPLYWCLCPGSNRHISGLRPPVELLRRNGALICLGTDSPASNPAMSLFEEMRLLAEVPLAELIAWATLHGARALGMEHELGSVEPGKRPGLCLLSGIDYATMRLTPASQLRPLL